jgi:hypothetical protein
LGEVVSAESGGGVSAATDDLTHPLVRPFRQTRHLLGEAKFWGYFGTLVDAERADTQPEDTAARATGESTGPARVALRLADGSHSPLIVERDFGLGRVVLITTTCDRQWNSWAQGVSYPVMMLELAGYASRRKGDEGRSVLVGSPIELLLAADRFEPTATVRDPDYPATAETTVRAGPSADGGRLAIQWEQTDRSGLYQFALRQRTGQADVQMAAVNVDTRESDLRKLGEAQLRSVLAGISFDYVKGSAELGEAKQTKRREFWPAVLLVAVGILMLEQFLAWRFGRSG